MMLNGLLILFLGLGGPAAPKKVRLVENPDQGTLTVIEGTRPVLSYQFGDRLAGGVDPGQTRSCYIHPVFGPDGKPLTDDFPQDHRHHHGLFWAWPKVRVRGILTQTWHPDDPPLRQFFVKWRKKAISGNKAIFSVENAWKLDGGEVVAREVVSLEVDAEDSGGGRSVDIELRLEAVGGPLELSGSPEGRKGYGGLCWRAAPRFRGAVMTTDKGTLDKDITDAPFRWADLSSGGAGMAIFVSPDHPGYPLPWLIRNSYAGVLNPSWPGLKSAVIPAGEAVTLRYRLYIHRGDVESGGVRAAYRDWLSGR